MRTIELSNHPADALKLARQRRGEAGGLGRAEAGGQRRAEAGGQRRAEAGGQRRAEAGGLGRGDAGQADHDEALARHELLVRRASSARDQARAQRRWLAWLRAALAVRKMRRLAPAPSAAGGVRRDTEEILRAGIAGEQQVAADLGAVLGDDWVLVRGYCNRRGEIDHLLLGPPGLIAIESKHRNATITCEGDDWRFEKFDNHGNLVDRGEVSDKRGRSPSVQLNEPADLLEEFLGSRGGKVSMLRVVLLTHPKSKLGRCRNATVHIATSATALARQLDDMPPVVGSARRARLEELIARDHRFHEERRPRPRPGTRSGPRPRPAASRTGRSAKSASK